MDYTNAINKAVKQSNEEQKALVDRYGWEKDYRKFWFELDRYYGRPLGFHEHVKYINKLVKKEKIKLLRKVKRIYFDTTDLGSPAFEKQLNHLITKLK